MILSLIIGGTPLLQAEAASNKKEEKATFELTMLDVGQGLSILIKADGKYMLYDGGDSPDYSVNTKIFKSFTEKLKKNGAKVVHPKAGNKYELGEADITVLHADNKAVIKLAGCKKEHLVVECKY